MRDGSFSSPDSGVGVGSPMSRMNYNPNYKEEPSVNPNFAGSGLQKSDSSSALRSAMLNSAAQHASEYLRKNKIFNTSESAMPNACSGSGPLNISGGSSGVHMNGGSSGGTEQQKRGAASSLTSSTQETWSNQEMEKSMGIERSLLAQLGAHLTPQQLERIASTARVGLTSNPSKQESQPSPQGPMDPLRIATKPAASIDGELINTSIYTYSSSDNVQFLSPILL